MLMRSAISLSLSLNRRTHSFTDECYLFGPSLLISYNVLLLQEVQNLAKKAAETVVLVIDEEGIEALISELFKAVGDTQA